MPEHDEYVAMVEATIDENKLFFLQALVLVYPLLVEKNIFLSGPIGIVVPADDEKHAIMKALPPFKSCKSWTPLSAVPKEFKKSFEARDYDFAGYVADYRRYQAQNLGEIMSHCSTPPYERLILILAAPKLPEQIRYAGKIYIGGKVSANGRETLFREFVSFVIKNEKTLFDNVMPQVSHVAGEFRVLTAVRLILDKFFSLQLNEENFNKFKLRMDDLQREIAGEWDTEDDAEIYVELLYKSLVEEIENLPIICDRAHLSLDESKHVQGAIFFDTDAYYLPEEVLEAIRKKRLPGCTGAFFKSQLARAGALACEGQRRSYYTKKIKLISVSGIIWEQRRIKIWRSRLDACGEFSLLECWQMREGRMEDEDSTWADAGNREQSVYLGEG